MIKSILTLFACFFAMSGYAAEATKTCNIGLNATHCRPNIVETSVWAMHIKAHQEDEQKFVVPGSERAVTLLYEFTPKRKHSPAKWRRTMLVDTEKGIGNVAMVEQGEILSVDANELKLATTFSSCDEDTTRPEKRSEFSIFYRRKNEKLDFSSTSFKDDDEVTTVKIIGKVVGAALEKSIVANLETKFSYPAARAVLTSNFGSFVSEIASSDKNIAQTNAQLGCFGLIETSFSKAKLSAKQ